MGDRHINVGILYIFAICSLGVYGIIMGGWASNSKYPFLGALRSAAQMVSYEVSIGFVIITVLLCVGSLNLTEIVEGSETGRTARRAVLDPRLVLAAAVPDAVFFISALAETNRPPFDLPEAESELVAGFMVEYCSTPYLLFISANTRDHPDVRPDVDPVPGRLAAADRRIAPFTWIPGVIWFVLQMLASCSSCSRW